MTDEYIGIRRIDRVNGDPFVVFDGKGTDKHDASATGTEEKTSVGAADGCAATGYRPHKYVAQMPTERYAVEYNMNHKHRGLALIFSHEVFSIPTLPKRNGTNVDCENLENSLTELHFEVKIFKDYKLEEIQHEIKHAASTDHSDNDCILIAIFSHGEHGYIYAKDLPYKLDTIWSYFTAQHCPTLAGKPKVFFVQACQGDGLDAGVELQMKDGGKTETDGQAQTQNYIIPLHADFLFAYSTIPGFYSWRNTEKGSWFVRELSKELKMNGKKYDILTLLTFVNQHVALDNESFVPNSPLMHRQKQTSCFTSMLTRILRFNDKKHNSS